MKQLVLLLALLLVGACGSNSASRIGPQGRRVNRLDPVNPKAAKEFEAAMRALRLKGPEANATAKVRLQAALEIDGKLWEAWHNLGVIAFEDGDDTAAVEAFGKALAINVDHVPILLARAEAHRRAGHTKDARTDYESALRFSDEDDPNRRDAAARLASLLRDGGNYDDAVNVLRDTVRLNGASAGIYVELGLIYIQQQRLELAQLVLSKAAELDAKDPSVFNALALLALRQGKAQDAFDRFDHAVSLDAGYIDARFNKASVLLDAGDYGRAKTELLAIVERVPDDYAARVALGVAYRGLKEFKDAKATWERVISSAPKRSIARADAMYDLALLELDFIQDQTAGKAALERYLQEAPSNHSKRQAADEKRKDIGS